MNSKKSLFLTFKPYKAKNAEAGKCPAETGLYQQLFFLTQ